VKLNPVLFVGLWTVLWVLSQIAVLVFNGDGFKSPLDVAVISTSSATVTLLVDRWCWFAFRSKALAKDSKIADE